MLKHTTHRWMIGLFLAACLMVVTGAAVASSSTQHTTWPAKCKTVKCVNTYLNSMHVGNMVRSAQIGKLQTQMVANARAHAVNAKVHLDLKAQLAEYGQTIADMKATIAGYDKEIAALKATNAAQATKIAALEAFKADLNKYVKHVDLNWKTYTVAGPTSGTTVDITTLVKAPDKTVGDYQMMYILSGEVPPPIFP